MKKSNDAITVFFLIVIAACAIGLFDLYSADLRLMLDENRRLPELSANLENRINSGFPEKNIFVDINGLMHRLLGQRSVNGVLLLHKGHETELFTYPSMKGIQANADSVEKLSSWLTSRGIDFFFCQVPTKIREGESIPAGYTDCGNKVADDFLHELSARDVRFLDLRKSLDEDGKDRLDYFLKTEHHWNSLGGFVAFKAICNYMEKEFNIEVDPQVLDLNSYTQKTYKNGSLGYYGQKTGFLFAGFDDFTLIYPSFETKQTCEIPHRSIFREGTFYETVFDHEKFKLPWRERGLYGVWIGGDYPLVIHHSETAGNGKTVLMFIDSYGTVPEGFLTTAFQNVIAVDLRWVLRNHWTKTAADYIAEYHPDIVIVMFNPNQIGNADSEQFQYGIEDRSER